MAKVVVSTHPIVQHKLARLRDIRTRPADFRQLVRSLGVLLVQEATADLGTVPGEVATPLGRAATRTLADVVGIVPILRAGLGMAEGILDLIPDAEVWHIGLFRDEATLRPTEYYNKFPATPRVTLCAPGGPHARHRRLRRPGLRDPQVGRSAAVETRVDHRRARGHRPGQ